LVQTRLREERPVDRWQLVAAIQQLWISSKWFELVSILLGYTDKT
jgi:hypothetical protein